MAIMRQLLLAFAALLFPVYGAENAANPIRKVVNLLQAMQKKVSAEGEKAEALYDKFMCYCKTSGGDLASSVAAAEAKIPELQSAIEAASSKKSQLEESLKSHQRDRAAAKENMATATALRNNEKAAYDKSLEENTVNLAATRKAVAAISEGMGSAFLQTPAAGILKAFVNQANLPSGDRQEVVSFLTASQNSEYAPASGEIVGILKTMVDEMQADQDEMIATEKAGVQSFQALIAAKKREVAVLSKSIEEKTARIGEVGVQIATMKNDAGDTADQLEEDKKFAANLKKNCAGKTGIHMEEKKQRAAEIVALADTIKILNDDDALELFKKTLPGAASSLIQLQDSSAAQRAKASQLLASTRQQLKGGKHHLDFILLALSGKKVGFDKIVKLIDELVTTLKKEQGDDDDKKEYCAMQFDQSDDKKKGLERSISDLETVIEESKEGVATLTEEIAALKAGIVALDKSVTEATEQRKEENAEYKELMASNTAAKELILFAKNRMQKFYNPKLYKAPAARELSRGDRIYENEGGDIPTEAPGGIAGTGIALVQVNGIPPPPATAAAYKSKSGESNGVLSMMDLLVSDLDKEMTIAETEEKNGSAEYAEMMADSADKRRQDSKSLTDKEAAKADLESSLEQSIADKKSTSKELMGTVRYISNLHGECDWLVQYFDVRKQARADEVDALGKAKAVLSGADFSLLQSSRARKFLRRA